MSSLYGGGIWIRSMENYNQMTQVFTECKYCKIRYMSAIWHTVDMSHWCIGEWLLRYFTNSHVYLLDQTFICYPIYLRHQLAKCWSRSASAHQPRTHWWEYHRKVLPDARVWVPWGWGPASTGGICYSAGACWCPGKPFYSWLHSPSPPGLSFFPL